MKNILKDALCQIPYVLDSTDFNFLGKKYAGKVRDNYSKENYRYLIATDRLSCFDRVVTTIPFKGQTLTDLTNYWFDQTKKIIQNHCIARPDPNVIIAKECQMLPIEIVVRNYLAGSAWRDYQEGKLISGVKVEAGLKKYQKLLTAIITPSTKGTKGDHDLPISENEILEQKLVTENLWNKIKITALKLFELGSQLVAKQGLILVDTKYEFGLWEDELILADEIHTMDSSRYWLASSYNQAFETGTEPEMLDKEPTRLWLLNQGFKGDGVIPEFSNQHRAEIALRYINAYQLITGLKFNYQVQNTKTRINQNLLEYLNNV